MSTTLKLKKNQVSNSNMRVFKTFLHFADIYVKSMCSWLYFYDRKIITKEFVELISII